ncbi:hypothetical protein ABTZ58_18090 [Streptomyces sp. NPDC094143]|uniref:hypothetical protein n=1 Tax=Streptomyces sp. NPDC094143 TaxID=3155310 RepID=UPI0033239056
MFKPFEYADGATGGGPQGVPNVYVPQGAPPPEYDAYADPAAAHGWQDACATADTGGGGDTRELPAVPARAGSGPGRRSRRKARPWGKRRVVVAAGVAGTASVVALIAAFSFSGASSGVADDGTRGGKGGRPAPTAGETESPAAQPSGGVRASTPGAPVGGGSVDGGPVGGGGDSDGASADPTAPASTTPSADGTDTPEPPAESPTAATPATSAPATTTPPGRVDGKPGRGPGGTKGPK